MGVITLNTWPKSWADVPAGTEVTKRVFEDILNAKPPINIGLYRGFTFCFQAGEPFDQQIDDKGLIRCRFLTFAQISGLYVFLGLQYVGEYKVNF